MTNVVDIPNNYEADMIIHFKKDKSVCLLIGDEEFNLEVGEILIAKTRLERELEEIKKREKFYRDNINDIKEADTSTAEEIEFKNFIKEQRRMKYEKL